MVNLRPVVTIAAAIVVIGASVLPSSALAQTTTTTPSPTTPVELTIERVTPWVADDGVFRIDLIAPGAPLDGSIRLTVRQPFAGTEAELRGDIIDSFDDTPSTDPLREPITTPLSELEVPGLDRFTLELPVRSVSSSDDRLFIPQPGVHPVDVALLDAAGQALDSTVVYLNHLPPADQDPARMSLGLVAEAHAPPLFDTAGEITDLEAARSEASLLARIAQLAGFRDIGVAVDPQIMVALATSENPNDGALVELLDSLLGDFEILASPWVPLDTEAWAGTGRSRTVATSLREGRDAVRSHLGATASSTIWPPDPRLGPASIGLLRTLDIEDVILESSQWDRSVLPRGRTGYSGSFTVGQGDDTLTAMSGDPDIESLFDVATDDPVLRAHRATTLLAASVLGSARRSNGAILTIGTDVDTDVLAAFVASLDLGLEPLVSLDSPSDAFAAAKAIRTGDDPLRSTLERPGNVRDLDSAESSLARLRNRSGSQAALLPRGDPESTRIANMLNSAQHLDLDQEVAERLAVAEIAIDFFLDAVTMPQTRLVNVTSRQTSIPLRFENSSDRTLSTRLLLSSPQLEFPDGEELDVDLEPGTNRIEIPTTVRSSGEFVIDVKLMVPDGSMTLVERRQRVRSTAFSGVGLILSGGALMFLIVWWYRTLRARDEELDQPRSERVDG
jgi:hypothetical protein